MLSIIKAFRQNETGAVTVDWVVLTAAIVGLAVAVMFAVSEGALDYTNELGDHLENQEIVTY